MPDSPFPRTSAAPPAVAVIPAAGSGSRMQSETPKQYLTIAGRTLLEHAVAAFLPVTGIVAVIVVVAPDDARASQLPGLAHERVRIVASGGATRRDSVLAGLAELPAQQPAEDCWVLVHDAARPGITPQQIARLLRELADDPVGGLLALPVVDTVKRAGDGRVDRTEPREGLWLAQTPQMFRASVLRHALSLHADVTDEAQAIERLSLRARLVRGSRRNLKVTMPEDLDALRALWEIEQ